MLHHYTLICDYCKQPFTSLRTRQVFCGKPCASLARWSRRPIDSAYWSKIDRADSPEPCWLWQEGTDSDGYGKCRVPGFSERRAHRIAYMLTYGPIPDGLWVLHKCDTPRCCNPAHLFLGTVVDNTADMTAKGRVARGDRHSSRTHPERIRRGECCSFAKLTAENVRLIRTAYARGGVKYATLAEQYGVSPATIGKVIRKTQWAHVA